MNTMHKEVLLCLREGDSAALLELAGVGDTGRDVDVPLEIAIDLIAHAAFGSPNTLSARDASGRFRNIALNIRMGFDKRAEEMIARNPMDPEFLGLVKEGKLEAMIRKLAPNYNSATHTDVGHRYEMIHEVLSTERFGERLYALAAKSPTEGRHEVWNR